MNKFQLALIWLLIFYSFSVAGYTEGIEFIKIPKELHNAPRVVEFFSFYCPHCYQFEFIYHVPYTISKNLPKDIKMERYHIDFLGSLGAELTKAWTIAMVLKVEDKVLPLLFEGVQISESINTINDIRTVFIKAGVQIEKYDIALNSFVVKSLVLKQQQAVKDFQLHAIPAIFVNGKFMIRNNGIIVKEISCYAKTYSDVINFLVNNK